MAGIISASSNDSVGVAAINWRTKILPIKIGPNHPVIGYDVSDKSMWPMMVEAINYVCELKSEGCNVRVLNMSLTFDSDGNIHSDAPSVFGPLFAGCRSKGILPVGGSGNFTHSVLNPVYPCRDENVLCVSAVDYNKVKVSYAQFGHWDGYPGTAVDLAGYATERNTGCGINRSQFSGSCGSGDNINIITEAVILGYEPYNSAYWCLCGDIGDGDLQEGDSGVLYSTHHHIYGYSPLMTSGTTAEASGLAALVFSGYPQLNVDQVEAMLKRGCVNVDDINAAHNPLYTEGDLGAGVMDAYRTLTLWGTVDRDTTLSGHVWVSGSVTFTKSVTVMPGTVFHVAPDDDRQEGHLISILFQSNNVHLAGTAESPIVFKGWAAVWDSTETTCWRGLQLYAAGSGSEVSHVNILHAETGLDVDMTSGLTVNEVTMDSVVTGINCDASSSRVTLSNVSVQHASYVGISLYGDSNQVTGVSIASSNVGVVDGAGADDVELTDADPSGCQVGILISGHARLQDIHVHDGGVYGVIVGGSGQADIVPGTLEISDIQGTGIKYDGVEDLSVLQDAVITGCTDDGVMSSGSHVQVLGCTLTYCGTGIEASGGGTVLVREAVFNGAGGIGLSMGTDGVIDAGTSSDHGHNAFQMQFTYYGTNGNTEASLEMIGNCYNGRETPKDSSKFVGIGVIHYLPGDCQ